MPVSVGHIFCLRYLVRIRSGVPLFGVGAALKLESSARIRSKWSFMGCALALICAGFAPRATVAQQTAADSRPSTTAPRKTTSATAKTSSTKTHLAANSHPGGSTHKSSRTVKSNTGATKPAGKSTQASLRKNGKRKKTARGQQKIDPERAQAIQEALIREHYLSGEAAGSWNQASEDAMRRYQAAHGWQSKTVPDSRALISLGLGPSHDHLLNPQSAMTTGPESRRAASLTPASPSPDPGPPLKTTPSPQSDSAPVSSGQDPASPQ